MSYRRTNEPSGLEVELSTAGATWDRDLGIEDNLGLATTRQLLEEIQARGETEPRYETEGNEMAIGAANLLETLPGSMLDYRTVDSDD